MRVFPLLLPALLVGGLLAGPPRASADLLYVLNSGEATVSVIDAATHTEIRRIQTLREPHHLVLTPDASQLLIADSGGNEVLFVDPATGEVRRRERISNPYHLEFSPDGRFLVVASLRRDQVDVYDANTLALLHRFRPGDMPSHVAFRPDSRVVYVTLQGDRGLAAFDLEARTQLWTVEVGPEPAGVIWHRGRLIVGIMGSDHFVTVDPETREVSRAFSLGRGAHTIYAAPDGNTLFATSRVDSRLAEVDAQTLAVRRVWAIPGGPDCLAFDPDGRVWMTLRWAGRVAVLDPVRGEVETLRVGRSPHGIFFKPRRPGVPDDFASFLPGAVSGSRARPAPLAGRQSLAQGRAVAPPTARPAPPVSASALEPVALPATPAALRRLP